MQAEQPGPHKGSFHETVGAWCSLGPWVQRQATNPHLSSYTPIQILVVLLPLLLWSFSTLISCLPISWIREGASGDVPQRTPWDNSPSTSCTSTFTTKTHKQPLCKCVQYETTSPTKHVHSIFYFKTFDPINHRSGLLNRSADILNVSQLIWTNQSQPCPVSQAVDEPCKLTNHAGVPPAVSLSPPLQIVNQTQVGGPRVFPWGAPEFWVLVLPLGFYRLPTESISLEETKGGIYPQGDRADPLNSLP